MADTQAKGKDRAGRARLLAGLTLAIVATAHPATARNGRQVNIETRFVEVQRDFTRQLGIGFEFGGTLGSSDFSVSRSDGVSPDAHNVSSSQGFAGLHVRMPFSILPGLAALDEVVRASLLATPVVGLNVRGYFGSGGEARIRTDGPPSEPNRATVDRNASVSPYLGLTFSVAQRDSNVVLLVTPRIGAKTEFITMQLDVDEAGQHTILRKETTRTNVVGGLDLHLVPRLSTGGTNVVMGLGVDVSPKSSIPLFGDTPLFGYLFRDRNGVDVSAKVELMVFITPNIIRSE